MNNRYIIQLIVILSSLVLGMVLYPLVLKKWRAFVEWLYRITYGDTKKEPSNKTEKVIVKPDENSSIVGKSKTKVGHSQTNTAKTDDSEVDTKKEDTFVPRSEEESPIMEGISVPLGKESPMTQEEMAEEEGPLDADPKEVAVASGASYDELMKTGKTIVKEQPTDEEKNEAGRILLENQNTELFKTMMAGSEKLSSSIASIIDFHLAKRAKEIKDTEVREYPDDFNDFDFNSIF